MDSLPIYAVVGAPDPERVEIIKILEFAGFPIGYACVGESPVNSDNAYQADSIIPPLPRDCHVWRIECDGPAFGNIDPSRIAVIDHHRPGDPGYGRPPTEFLEASSIGQVMMRLAQFGLLDPRSKGPDYEGDYGGEHARRIIGPNDRDEYMILNWADYRHGPTVYVIPHTCVFAAAIDHCPDAAFRGECPGVDPHMLIAYQQESIVKHDRIRGELCVIIHKMMHLLDSLKRMAY